MAIQISRIRAAVRGLVIDQTESGITAMFTDAEILEAINSAKDDFFGRRPEAFCLSSVATTAPADLTGDETAIDLQGWAIHQFCYGVASFLMAQRGKDSYYRKAADALFKKYTEA
jgi:hypothetical protein